MTLRLSPSLKVADLCDALEVLALESGNPAFSRAARALYQQDGGRPSIDDRMAIAEARELLSTGKAKSVAQALAMVAKARSPAGDERAVRSMAERLRRKIALEKKQHKTVKVDSVAA